MLKELYRLSCITREVLEQFCLDNDMEYRMYNPYDLQGACGSASLLLCEVFSSFNFTKRAILQEYYFPYDAEQGCHCWVRFNNQYFIDVTCTQFGGPRVYISPDRPYEHLELPWEDSFVTTYLPVPSVNTERIREDMIERGWPDDNLFEPDVIGSLADNIVNDYYARFDRQLQSVA